MPPARIITWTLNPAVDFVSTAPKLQALHKIRTHDEHVDPGGGGVNVARVVHALGGETLAVFAGGGVTGRFLAELLTDAGVPHHLVPIAGRTRVSFTVRDASSGLEYRFVPEGPTLSEVEWRAALAALPSAGETYLVASGSLPRGVPEDIYANAARAAAARGQSFVLDTSGPALHAALGHGLALIKPSLREFESLCGETLTDIAAVANAARRLVGEGGARIVVVTLGAEGAVLADEAGARHRPALDAAVHSAVGAGDAFLGAMVLALAGGARADEALDWGLAAGAVAVSGIGTARITRAAVEELFHRQSHAVSYQSGQG
jgi:6-phosphofructokinase 2